MNNRNSNSESAAKIWKASFFAVLVAFVLLFTVVLPGGFGIGLGGKDRVSEISTETDLEPEPASEPDPLDDLASLMAGGAIEAEPGTHKSYDQPYRTEVISISMASLEEVEYKAHMKAGDTIIYSWKSNQTMYVDVHGEPHTYPEDDAVRYEEVDGITSGQGWIRPSFDGMHGWFWMNTGESDDVIELTISGYYEKAEEVYRSTN
jgi:hypothetical protein